MKKELACIAFGLLLQITGQPLGAQNQLGFLPAIQFNGDLTEKLAYNFGWESQINTISQVYEMEEIPAEVLTADFQAALSYDVTPDLNLAGALIYRFRNPFTEGGMQIRPWQQITLINRLQKYRLRHRFRIEERFNRSEKGAPMILDLRLRYRLSVDFPLNGQRLDEREFYANLSNESLFTPLMDDFLQFWENRTNLGIGYQFISEDRLEGALELRTEKQDADSRRNFFFIRLTWIHQIRKA